MYTSGPVGRMAVEEVLNAVRSRERRRLEKDKPDLKSRSALNQSLGLSSLRRSPSRAR